MMRWPWWRRDRRVACLDDPFGGDQGVPRQELEQTRSDHRGTLRFQVCGPVPSSDLEEGADQLGRLTRNDLAPSRKLGDPAFPVGVNSLELGMHETGPNQGREAGVGVKLALQVHEKVCHSMGGGPHSGLIASCYPQECQFVTIPFIESNPYERMTP